MKQFVLVFVMSTFAATALAEECEPRTVILEEMDESGSHVREFPVLYYLCLPGQVKEPAVSPLCEAKEKVNGKRAVLYVNPLWSDYLKEECK